MADLTFVAGGSGLAYSNADQTVSANSGWCIAPIVTEIPTSGLWYAEFMLSGSSMMFGVAATAAPISGEFPGQGPTPGVSQGDDSRLSGSFGWVNSSSFSSSSGSIGIAVNADTGSIRWYAGGSLQAAEASFTPGLAGLYFVAGPYPGRGSATIVQAASATLPSGYSYISDASAHYEVAGTLRVSGVVLTAPRRVRVYRRSDGALLGQADSIDGNFAINVGISDPEVYIIPIDLDSGATDWAPPCANRVVPVLAA